MRGKTEELQRRVDKIVRWASDWKMEINPGKSKVMHLRKKNPGFSYHVNGTEIKTVTTEKDISFWIICQQRPMSTRREVKC